jgi:single-strand DNA-binding protein
MINKVFLLGRLGHSPEVKHLENGGVVANMSLATSETWRDKESGEKNERTEWHKIVAFGKTAEIAERYLEKGDQIHVEGKIQSRKWTDREGQTRYAFEIVANSIQMLGGKRKQERENQAAERVGETPPRPVPPDLDDDIPF